MNGATGEVCGISSKSSHCSTYVPATHTTSVGVMNSEMSGHSGWATKEHDTLNFGFEFRMDEQGKHCGRYQPLEQLASPWYPLTLIRANESDCGFDAATAIVIDLYVEVHPLKEYPSIKMAKIKMAIPLGSYCGRRL